MGRLDPASDLVKGESEINKQVVPYGNVVDAIGRRLRCPFSSRASIVYIYVHIAKFATLDYVRHQAEDRSWNVAFRYRGADPILSWLPPHRMQIAVEGAIEIDKQLIRIHGIPIDYVVGRGSDGEGYGDPRTTTP